MSKPSFLIILFGPPGSGKTTIGMEAAKQLNCDFYDMDQSMPKELKEKMNKGELMNDAERENYLAYVKQDIATRLERGPLVAGCVLVREKHRKEFCETFPKSIFFKLETPASVLKTRLKNRPKHFFKENGLQKMLDAEETVRIKHHCLNTTLPISETIKSIEATIKDFNKAFGVQID